MLLIIKFVYMNHISSFIGRLYESENNLIKAETLYQECYEGCQKTLGVEHFLSCSSLDNLVDLFVYKSAYEKGIKLLSIVLTLRKSQLGTEHSLTLSCMNNLAFMYEKLNQSVQAELLYRECCDTYVSIYGPENSQSLLAMTNLANFFYKHSKYEFALEVFRGCFEIQSESLGNNRFYLYIRMYLHYQYINIIIYLYYEYNNNIFFCILIS